MMQRSLALRLRGFSASSCGVATIGLRIAGSAAGVRPQTQILQSENVRLKGEIAEVASPDNIEAYAKEHGMVKVEPNQIHYFSVDSVDRAELPADGGENFFTGLWKGVVGLFS